MKPQLMELYRLLDDPSMPEPARGLERSGVRGPTDGGTASPGDLPLLPEEVPQLERLLEQSPTAVCEFLAKAKGVPAMSVEEARAMLAEVQGRLENPEPEVARLRSAFTRAAPALPADFDFEGYDPTSIPIDASLTRFEERADWFAYVVKGGMGAALHHAGLLPLGPFRWHHEHASGFDYPLEGGGSGGLRVALFSDFANGLPHARYLARLLERKRYPYAIHLGDVYYAGDKNEVQRYLEEPLSAVLGHTELFLLAGNHEMYRKGRPWLDYIDRKHEAAPTRQRQEGTYFRLRTPGFQLVGIDTEWFGHARYHQPQLVEWLARSLQEGRRDGCMNILLSSNEPYEYGKAGATKLLDEDFAALVNDKLVDAWFWGNTHYGALFEPGDGTPFVGSCIGHGGFPYERVKKGEPSLARPRFLETAWRFEPWDLRQDMGNNGFCELHLRPDGKAGLTFIDWRGRTRHVAVLGRDAAGRATLSD